MKIETHHHHISLQEKKTTHIEIICLQNKNKDIMREFLELCVNHMRTVFEIGEELDWGFWDDKAYIFLDKARAESEVLCTSFIRNLIPMISFSYKL